MHARRGSGTLCQKAQVASRPRDSPRGQGLIKAHLVSALAADNHSREYLGADMDWRLHKVSKPLLQ